MENKETSFFPTANHIAIQLFCFVLFFGGDFKQSFFDTTNECDLQKLKPEGKVIRLTY